MKKRTEGRRATDKELSHLRRLELILRNFITHYDDELEQRFAPRTRQMVKEAREVCEEVDALRAPRSGAKPAA